MSVPNLRYMVGANGWAAGANGPLGPGVIVDTSLARWWEDVWTRPPPDAVPLDQQTYDYMVSNGVVGLSYPYWTTAVVAGVVGVGPPAWHPV
jgi:hypothetical protein